MAQLDTFTGLSSLNDVVPSGQIGDLVLGYNYAPTVAQLVAWIENLEPGKGSTFTFPRFDEVTVPAGTKLESDLMGEAELTTAGTTVTPAYFGLTAPISYEVMHDAQIGVRASSVVEFGRAVRNRVDQDLLSLATSLTTTVGTATSPLSLPYFNTIIAAAKTAIRPEGGQLVLIAAPSGIRDLLNDTVLESATMLPGLARDIDLGGLPIVGSIGGVLVLESANIPTSGGGFEGIVTVAGRGRSCLGMVVAEKIGAGYDVIEQRKVLNVTVSARIGFGVTAQRLGISFLHRA